MYIVENDDPFTCDFLSTSKWQVVLTKCDMVPSVLTEI